MKKLAATLIFIILLWLPDLVFSQGIWKTYTIRWETSGAAPLTLIPIGLTEQTGIRSGSLAPGTPGMD